MDDVLAEAFRRHYRQIYAYVRRSGSSHADSEDITQEVFAQAAAGLEQLRTDSRPLAAWLYTVAQRRLADEGRRRARATRVARLSTGAGAALPLYGANVAKSIRRALGNLTDPQRQVVVLKLVEGKPFAEIARLLGTTEAASRMVLARSRTPSRRARTRGDHTMRTVERQLIADQEVLELLPEPRSRVVCSEGASPDRSVSISPVNIVR